MAQDFDALRQTGMKVILRFAYTKTLTDENGPYGDAPLSVASSHIDQLAPLLKVHSPSTADSHLNVNDLLPL